MAQSRDRWICMSLPVRYAAWGKKKKKIQCLSAGVSFFVLVCGNSRYPSQPSCVVSKQRRAGLLLRRCLSRRMCYYQASCMQMCIKISVQWRHDITNALFGWGKGHIIATYSVIRWAECPYITWATTKIKNVSAGVFPVWECLCVCVCVFIYICLLKASTPSWPRCDSAHLRAAQALGERRT